MPSPLASGESHRGTSRLRGQSQGYIGRMVFYCGDSVPTGDEEKSTSSHSLHPKHESEMRPGWMRAWETLIGFPVALAEDRQAQEWDFVLLAPGTSQS